MNKKELIARWSEPGFQKSIRFEIDKLITKSVLNSEVDLRGITIGCEGPIEDLWYANMANCILSYIDFSHSTFEGSFKEAAIENSKFVGTSFESCRIFEAKFIACNFEKAKIKTTSMDGSYLENCNFAFAKFIGKFLMGYGARRAEFIRCDFSNVLFSGVEYRACKFDNCVFGGAKFEKCVLSGVKFLGNAPKAEQFDSCDVQHSSLNGEELLV